MDFTKDVRETIGRYNRNIVAALGADRFSLYATADIRCTVVSCIPCCQLTCNGGYERHSNIPQGKYSRRLGRVTED
jgi:hypothetical protein